VVIACESLGVDEIGRPVNRERLCHRVHHASNGLVSLGRPLLAGCVPARADGIANEEEMDEKRSQH